MKNAARFKRSREEIIADFAQRLGDDTSAANVEAVQAAFPPEERQVIDAHLGERFATALAAVAFRSAEQRGR